MTRPPSPRPPGPQTHPLLLALILLGALAVRLAAAWRAQGMIPFGDPKLYWVMATRWAKTGAFTVDEANLWPPGNIVFLGLHIRHLGDDQLYPRLTLCVLSTASVYLLYHVSLRLTGRRGLSLLAAAAVALYPTLVAFSHYLWPETLYMFFFLAAAAAFLEGRHRGVEGGRVGPWFFGAGVAFGLACLTKAIGVYAGLFWGVWFLLAAPAGGRGRAARQLATFAAAAAMVILPWSVKISAELKEPVLIDLSLGRNLYYGQNALPPPNWDYGMVRSFRRDRAPNRQRCDELLGPDNPKEVERCEIRGAVAFIRENPDVFFARFGLKMADLWAPTSPLVFALANHRYADPPRGKARAAAMLGAIAPYLLLGIGVVMAFCLTPWTRERWFVVALLAYFLGVHWITCGSSRYRLTLEPLLWVLAVQGWVDGWAALRRPRAHAGQLVAFAAALGLLLFMWSRRLNTGLAEAVGDLLG